MTIGAAILIFLSAAALDFVWARYNAACAKHKVLGASIYATLIMSMSGLNAMLYIENHVMLLFAMLGAFVGTFVSLKTINKH